MINATSHSSSFTSRFQFNTDTNQENANNSSNDNRRFAKVGRQSVNITFANGANPESDKTSVAPAGQGRLRSSIYSVIGSIAKKQLAPGLLLSIRA